MQYLPCLLHVHNPDKSDRAVPYNLYSQKKHYACEDHDSRLGFTFMSFLMRAYTESFFFL